MCSLELSSPGRIKLEDMSETVGEPVELCVSSVLGSVDPEFDPEWYFSHKIPLIYFIRSSNF